MPSSSAVDLVLGHEAPAELDLHAGGLGRLGRGLDLVARRVAHLVGRHRVDHAEADAPVLADRLGLVRIDDRETSSASRPWPRILDGGLVVRVGELLALWSHVHDACRGAAGTRVLLVQQILSPLRLGARNLELARTGRQLAALATTSTSTASQATSTFLRLSNAQAPSR